MDSPCLVALLVFSFVIGSCFSDNPIDSCWRGDSNWAQNRMKLADCAVGFGSSTMGGKGGDLYTVTNSDDDPVNPAPGTLRYGATRDRPLWIIFSGNMNIKLKMPMYIAGYKTFDGRGAQVYIGNGGPCVFIKRVSNVIIHGLYLYGCSTSVLGNVLINESFGVEPVHPQDGDALTLRTATNIWIDHNSFSNSSDGLVDVTLTSTGVTISNNLFFNHHKVMLLGHDDAYSDDKSMKVTVAFNQFGPNCGQRMPRARYGLVHVANNNYDPWTIYAIGGSSNPTILSEGNSFTAPNESYKKQVTIRIGCKTSSSCSNWVWQSTQDVFYNGAYFVSSGKYEGGNIYTKKEAFNVENGNATPQLTKNAGVLTCSLSKRC